jgi:hypothetical protein
LGKAMKGTEQKATRKIYFDLADEDTYDVINELPNWMIGVINKSAEAIARKIVFMKTQNGAAPTAHVDDATDDDVPF